MDTKLKVRQRVHYTTEYGKLFSASVRVSHRDGTYTIAVRFEIIDDEESGTYIGANYRVPSHMLRAAFDELSE
ncbi:MAG: hypothetical protein WC683_18335 [bacterium]